MSLDDSEIRIAADNLDVSPCVIKAVIKVESAGQGFLPDGRVKILFEGHIFWKQLLNRKIDPAPHAKKLPHILHQKWTKENYKNSQGEWERLEVAMRINKEAALCSASWGLFQIMGFNYKECGFDSVQDFVTAQESGEYAQLLSFCRFLRSENLVGFLQEKDWSGFARKYNGPSYARNNYDGKLRQAFIDCSKKGS